MTAGRGMRIPIVEDGFKYNYRVFYLQRDVHMCVYALNAYNYIYNYT